MSISSFVLSSLLSCKAALSGPCFLMTDTILKHYTILPQKEELLVYHLKRQFPKELVQGLEKLHPVVQIIATQQVQFVWEF